MSPIEISPVEISPAREEDAEAIINVHYAAVHQSAASAYPNEILQQWSRPISAERIERIGKALLDDQEIRLVARIDGLVVGFGSISLAEHQLVSLYVHPDHGRQGVGAHLLRALEEIAIAQGIPLLEMDASLNAEGFYLKQGFAIVERSVHRFRSGFEMPCVKMRKQLAVPSDPTRR